MLLFLYVTALGKAQTMVLDSAEENTVDKPGIYVSLSISFSLYIYIICMYAYKH